MDDRELLELAAKAVGYQLRFIGNDTPFSDGPERVGEWNPLKSDGDALRLAVKLHIQVTGNANGVGQAIWSADNPCGFAVINEENPSDPYAAARRAIVRAAAEIGRACRNIDHSRANS